LPTGGFSRCSFSLIHFWKSKALSRPVFILPVPLHHAADGVCATPGTLSPQVSKARRVVISRFVRYCVMVRQQQEVGRERPRLQALILRPIFPLGQFGR
jgi:hypothetical protein